MPFVGDFGELEGGGGSSAVSLAGRGDWVCSSSCSGVSLGSAFDELGRGSSAVSLDGRGGRLCSGRCLSVSFDILR